MAHLSSLSRAAVVGLILGLAGAAIVLVANAWDNSTRVCDFPDTQECLFEVSSAHEVSRLQTFAAVGFALLAGGLSLALRRK